MKVRRVLKGAIPFVLCAAVLLTVMFYPEKRESAASEKRVIRVWNVDTFEGGKGSRTTFLKSAARETEKRRKGVYYLVTAYTPEGAEAAFREGNTPDVLSFGVGLSVFAERSLSLPYSFTGGTAGGECLAYPWCRGRYALFSLSENFEEEGSTAISVGGNNLVQVAACLEGIAGEELPSLSAYTKFLSGEYRYLLGTQRDICRFSARGVTVYQKPLENYNDLYQYFSVLSTENREDCLALLETLLSEKLQGRLTELGLYPVAENGSFAESARRTISVFTDSDALIEVTRAAQASDINNLEKFLKVIEK